MTELETKIQKASQAYYTDGSSDLSDAEFDALVEQLRREQPDSRLLQKIGLGYDIEYDTTPGEKYPHKYGEAGSLNKAYAWNEIDKVFRNNGVDISAKLDGLSVVLYYQNGKLVQALTRGDGHIGIDITDKAKYILGDNIKDTWFTGAIRGEAVMSHANFQKFKTLHPEAKNARNSAAGLINGKKITTDFDLLDIVPYSIVGIERLGNEAHCDDDVLEDIRYIRSWLSTNFTNVVKSTYTYLAESNFNEDFNSWFTEWSKEYPIDGLVITSGNVVCKSNGVVVQTSQAFKFKAETAQSKVIDVEWNMSKSGYAVPRVHIETVQLSGTNVSYCAGENAKNIINNKIGIGAIVEVEKHGEIIPNINEVITPAAELNVPEVCPHCKSKLEWAGVHLACMNEGCGSASYHDVMIWTDVLAPVDNLGRKLKRQFFEDVYGHVPTIEELMEHHDEVEKSSPLFSPTFKNAFKGTQAYRMRQMLDMLFGDSTIKLSDAIRALNIPRFGDVNANKLAQYSDELRQLLNIACDGSCGDGALAANILNHLSNYVGDANITALANHMDKLSRLRFIEHRIDWTVPTTEKATSYMGKVTITGKLSVKRSVFEQELKDAGYTPGNIAKDTKFLITDDPNSTSSKNRKADEWGITKITEAQFRKNYM